MAILSSFLQAWGAQDWPAEQLCLIWVAHSHGPPPPPFGFLSWVLSFWAQLPVGRCGEQLSWCMSSWADLTFLDNIKSSLDHPFMSVYPHGHYFYHYAVGLPTVPAYLLGGQVVTLSWPEQAWEVSLSMLLKVSLEHRLILPLGPLETHFAIPRKHYFSLFSKLSLQEHMI